jgi:hypothetical protein
MTLPIVLTVAGCVALLVGLFGGGVKAKEIVVPKISILPRIFSIVMGIGLIWVGTQLSLIPDNSSPIPAETLAPEPPTAAPIPPTLALVLPAVTTIPPTLSPTIEEPVGHAPVIESVDLWDDLSSGRLDIVQDISFHDEDGDAYYIDFELVSNLPNVHTVDGPISASSQQQKSGTIHTGRWGCGGGQYEVTLQATILDGAGNQSNAVEYTMFCHD